jgi:hypothetical protein
LIDLALTNGEPETTRYSIFLLQVHSHAVAIALVAKEVFRVFILSFATSAQVPSGFIHQTTHDEVPHSTLSNGKYAASRRPRFASRS